MRVKLTVTSGDGISASIGISVEQLKLMGSALAESMRMTERNIDMYNPKTQNEYAVAALKGYEDIFRKKRDLVDKFLCGIQNRIS